MPFLGGGDPHSWDDALRLFKALCIGVVLVVVVFCIIVVLIAIGVLPDELRKEF